MVDPKDTNGRTGGAGSNSELVARKVWLKPRLETFDISMDTAATSPGPPHGDGSNSVS